MSNSVQDPDAMEQSNESAGTAMESPVGKGKGKAVEQIPGDDSDEDDEEEDGEDDIEEVEEDNMEEIDMDNIVGSRTRNKNIDFAQAAKDLPDDDDDDEDGDGDFEGDDDDDEMMED